MANKIILKKTSTASKVPLSTDLEVGEIAVNLADQKLYSKNASGTVILVGSGGGGSGDVIGPTSATDNALARFDTTTGKLIQNGVITQDDNGTLANVNAVSFDTTPTSAPTTTGSMYWDNGNQTPTVVLNANTDLQLGQENIALVYNGTGSTIAKGSVVAVSGAQGQRPRVVLADADTEPLSAATLGITAEAIANGAEGFVCTFGLVRGLNTSAFTAGAPIYLSQTAGAFTATRPSAPAHTVALGYVISINASSGEVFVNINNGWELDELHNVLITSPASGNTLIYDATAGVWKNNNLTDGTGISITEGAGSITVTNTAPDQVVSLTQGGATTITGTYPNFTISSVNTTYSAATSTALGLIELNSDTVQTVAANAVTATTSRSYGLQVNASGQGVINVPWTDTVYTLPAATTTTLGGIELGDGTVQTVAANAVTATASRSYALQVNSAGQGVINVPWTDTDSGGTVTSVSGTGSINGLTLTGTVTTTGNLTLGGSITSVATTGNFQMNSLGVGTAGSATAGEIRATNNVTAYYASDRKWKENIKPIYNALEKVEAIGGKTFDWTKEYTDSHGGIDGYFIIKEDFGVIAQDVQKAFPQAVRTRKDGTLAVDYAKLSALALQAIADLSIKVSNLERKLKD